MDEYDHERLGDSGYYDVRKRFTCYCFETDDRSLTGAEEDMNPPNYDREGGRFLVAVVARIRNKLMLNHCRDCRHNMLGKQ